MTNSSSATDTPLPQVQDRPNILWITTEDISPVLGCYGDSYAITPHLDQFAADGVLYTNAFATAPVCSPSRSCLINGLPATSQGTHQMRSAFPIPEYMTGFPSILRKAGHYTTNNVKTDYNNGNWEGIVAASWDESSDQAHWRDRQGDQSFFSVFNLMTSHQSRTMVWPYEQFLSEVQSKLEAGEIHDPSEAPVPPYYPDTPVIRKTLARFQDCITAMDKDVGAILQQLEDDGLAENTIVFFYSDHGSGMPRHKRTLLDSGLNVPLIIRFPEKYEHLAPSAPGSRSDRLVSFDDFGPTVLSLADLEIPDYMEGQPFLGTAAASPREYTYGHRDRVDEVHDLARSVRDKRLLYIRNYMPHLGYNQPTAWPDLGEIRHEIYAHARTGSMTGPQEHFAGPTRPLEELYDCHADPQNLENLARSPAYSNVLERMRMQLDQRLRDSRDLGFVPEALAWQISEGTTLYELARASSNDYQQSRLIKAASQVGQGTENELLANLAHDDPGVRYWGAIGLSAAKSLSQEAVDSLIEALDDEVPNARIEGANALARHGRFGKSISTLADALEGENLAAVQHAARAIELLGEKALAALPAVVACDARMKAIRSPGTSPLDVDPEKDKAMFVAFCTEAFLKRFGSNE
ncbi:MAG: sulfatase-like hydrolase/transferase [Opitutales bacterium]|jgi:N-sulfoglucosamine sulfohydrolase|nr:sulfatase-like hydrolase/transferase [Opitutales bacterium]MBT6379752.1 sulfatase-like hydrolase/transferase [Opitutales bacterium]MBT7864731.1 sulfatase-like hydrolase/transferase [Opitutales bacterium]